MAKMKSVLKKAKAAGCKVKGKVITTPSGFRIDTSKLEDWEVEIALAAQGVEIERG
jgi:hypothetical protein